MLLDKIRPLVRKNIALIFAATCLIVCFAYFFGYKTVDVHNSIDGSWQYTLSELRNSPGELGKDILYTYGPLFERLAVYPVPDDNNIAFLVTGVLFTAIAGTVIFSLVKFWQYYAKNKALTWIVALLVGYVLLTITQLDSLYYLSLFITVLAARRARNPWERAIMLTGIALFSLYKVSFSITFLIALPAIFIVSAQLKNLPGALLKCGTALAGYIVLFTAITGGGNFLTYAYTGLQNSVAYNEFMSLSFATNKEITMTFAALFFVSVAASAGVLAYTFLYKRVRWRNEIVFAALLIYFVTFFIFKQSVIRSDDHLLAFTPFLPLIVLAPALLMHNVRTNLKIAKRGVQAFAMLCVLYFAGHLLLQKNLSDISPGEYASKRATFVKDALVNQPLNYFAFSSTRQEITNDIAAREPEIAEIKAQLDRTYPGRPILVYGNTTILSDFLKEGRVVRQAPFVQNYAAFPPQIFDSRYIDFLKKYPDALVFVEETEASINERIPAHELNNFFMYLTHNYRVVLKNSVGTQYVLENRGTAAEATCRLVQSTWQSKGAALTIPEFALSQNQYINMKVDFPPDIVELGIGTLIKKPVYNVTLINQDGGAMIRRSSQSTLQHGVTVSPLFLSFRAYADNADFDLKHVIISGGITRQSHYTANFELCTFNK